MSKKSTTKPAGRLTRPRAETVRAQIQASQIVRRLTEHVEGRVDMSPTQVQAARTLLGKVLPDLQTAELIHHEEPRTEAEILARLQSLLKALPADIRDSLDAAAMH